MIHHCPKIHCRGLRLVWQPSKRRFYCPNCHGNYTRLEVAYKKGGKE